MFFHLVLYCTTNDRSCGDSEARQYYVHLPGLTSATLGDFVRIMRQYECLIQVSENNEGSISSEENEQNAQYFSVAATILTP